MDKIIQNYKTLSVTDDAVLDQVQVLDEITNPSVLDDINTTEEAAADATEDSGKSKDAAPAHITTLPIELHLVILEHLLAISHDPKIVANWMHTHSRVYEIVQTVGKPLINAKCALVRARCFECYFMLSIEHSADKYKRALCSMRLLSHWRWFQIAVFGNAESMGKPWKLSDEVMLKDNLDEYTGNRVFWA
ncbi:hypothetical protein EDC01DRAFT_629091 [Geopyxis carbonaria]|nr:hypothetical protein EDC01DRAFT_629091 [Geopyxis carbonaria]